MHGQAIGTQVIEDIARRLEQVDRKKVLSYLETARNVPKCSQGWMPSGHLGLTCLLQVLVTC